MARLCYCVSAKSAALEAFVRRGVAGPERHVNDMREEESRRRCQAEEERRSQEAAEKRRREAEQEERRKAKAEEAKTNTDGEHANTDPELGSSDDGKAESGDMIDLSSVSSPSSARVCLLATR